MTKEETKHAARENENLIRNEANYIPGRNGIKEVCILNFLSHYKVYQNFAADLTHDLFLGVFKRSFNEILLYLLNSGVNINEINEAFASFNWGSKDKEYRPPPFTESKIRDKSLNLYAREVWAVIDYLLFFLKKILATENTFCQFALVLVDILD